MVGLFTGHYGLRDHLHKMRLVAEQQCRFCSVSPESVEHILCECEALERKRLIHLGKARVTPDVVWKIEITWILDFINGLNLTSTL
jgi:hypothetical protein